VALELPVYHILEPEIREQVNPDIAEKELALMEISLEVDKITEGLNRVRNK
jgi:hypothetical protein